MFFKIVSREFIHDAEMWRQTNEKRRVYDGMDIVQERDQNNVVTASLTRAGNIGGILARTTNAGSVFYGYDGSGNVTTLTNSAGAEVGSYTYDAFGNTVATSGSAASENPYQFSTKESIGGLYSYGFRFYSPGLGRWINRDPIREAGGFNLYGFVGNNPTNEIDHYGLWTLSSGGGFSGNLGPIHVGLGWQSAVGHDTCQPWYRGWSGSPFLLNAGGGLGAGLGGSAMGSIGFTDANNVTELTGKGREVGGSAGEGIIGGFDLIEGGWHGGPADPNPPYFGSKLSLGIGAGTPAEVHGDYTLTGGPVWDQSRGWH